MVMNPPCVIVGRDVTLYTIQGFGENCDPTAQGSPITLLGRWKTVPFENEFNWEDTTPSSARWVTRRITTIDWRAVLEDQIQSNGSLLMYDMAGSNDLVQIIFSEITGGGVYKMTGGIARVSTRGERGEFTETLGV